MQFYQQSAFFLIWIIAGIVLLALFAKRRRESKLKKLVDLNLLKNLAPNLNTHANFNRALLFSIAVLFFILALARPQWGEEEKIVKQRGIDVIFLLDTSLSMLAEDVKPSRIAKAHIMVNDFLDKFKGDRIGLVNFAGGAFLQSPLTLDYSAFRLFLDASNVGIIPEQGTDFKEAIAVAIKAFGKDKKNQKAMIILSDGENHSGSIKNWIRQAVKDNVRIYTIGIGTKKGEPIPLKASRKKITAYKKDKSGNIVISKLQDKVLQEIAKGTGGHYFIATPTEHEVSLIYRDIQSLEKHSLKEKQLIQKEDRFQLFLLFGLIFLFCEMLIRDGVRKKAPTDMVQLSLLLLLWSGLSAFSLDPLASNTNKGNELFEQEKYDEALNAYRSERLKNPDNPKLQYNIGSTLYKKNEFRESEYQFQSSLKDIQNPTLKAKAYYNHGNALYRVGKIDEAIQSYRKAIELNSKDQDAKFNFELLKRKKQSESEKNKDDSKKEDKKEQQDQQEQQKQQEQDQEQQQQDQQQQDQQQQQNQQEQQGQSDSQQQQNEGGQSDQSQSGKGAQDEQKDDSQSKEQDKQEKDQKSGKDSKDSGDKEQESQEQSQGADEKDQKTEQGDSKQDSKQQGEESDKSKDKDEGESDQKEKESGREGQEKSDQKSDPKDKSDETKDEKRGAEDKSDKGEEKDPSEEEKREKSSGDKGEEPEDKSDKGDKEEDRGGKGPQEEPAEEPQPEPGPQPQPDLNLDLKSELGGEEPQTDQPSEGDSLDKPKSPPMGPPSLGPEPQPGEGGDGAVGQTGQVAPRFFDGQMSEKQALKILNALQNEEKDLLNLRRPPSRQKGQPSRLKDW